MAGGRFDKAVEKVRPGTYINFEAAPTNGLNASARGTVVMPLINHSYGPAGEFIYIDNAAPDAAKEKLGYSIYDDNDNMLMIREALKECATVVAYIPKAGTKATGSGGGLTATAKYGGTRGNALSFSVAENPVAGFDITITLGGETVSLYEGVANIAEAIAIDDAYVDFTKTTSEAVLSAIAGVSLANGTDGVATNEDMTAFLDAVECVNFDVLCLPTTDNTIKAAAKSEIMYLRENVGKTVTAVVSDYNADYEGIINVTNSVKLGDKSLTKSQVTAWVAGVTAGADYTESNTYKAYSGATDIVGAKTHEQAVAALKNGEFFFSFSEQGEVVIESDINSLVTISDKKNKSYCKNRTIRVFDAFADSLQLNFPPNTYPNTEEGWDVMEGVGRSILKSFEDDGVIKNVDGEADFLVDRERSEDDQTYFNVGLEPIYSSEKLYFTVITR